MPFLLNIILEILTRTVSQGKDIKKLQWLQRKRQRSHYLQIIITNIENPKESSDKLIIINFKAFSEVSGYKTNERKSIALLDTSN